MAKRKVTNRKIANPFQNMSTVSDFLLDVGELRTGVSFESSFWYLSFFGASKSDPP